LHNCRILLHYSDMSTRRLHLDDYLARDQNLHVARYECWSRVQGTMHCHDFYEVFWLERGRLTHMINGTAQPLDAGDLILVAPEDRHTLRARGQERASYVNVALPAKLVEDVLQRSLGDIGIIWGQQRSSGTIHRLGPPGIDRLAEIIEMLAGSGRDQLMAEWFILSLLVLIRKNRHRPAGDAGPEWLETALAEFTSGHELALGPARLAELAGRSPRHVNRSIRRFYGTTATKLVNRLRLERAARLLQMTNRPIQEIARQSGFNNLGHFYRRFWAKFNTSPRQYRLNRRAVSM
jgi:AraC-like DNA-binding protein/mannose-6-phosphate isomerase-like protein (cupin superfamily)